MSSEPGTVDGSGLASPLQFLESYVYEAHVTRELAKDAAPSQPQLRQEVAGHELSPDGLHITVLVRVVVTYKYRDTAIATIDCVILGHFVSSTPVKNEAAAEFAGGNAIVILWPYLRAAVAQLAVSMQVPFPPLPMIDIGMTLESLTTARGKARRPARAKGR